MFHRHAVVVAAIVAVVAVLYWPAVGAYFFEDDFQWLVSRWTFMPRHLLALEHFDHFYRPVIELYFWAGLALFGESAAPFHVANIALHAANGYVSFRLARAVSGDWWYGLAAALTFVVMPAYVEAIAWVSALAEAVGAFFGMLAVLGWLTYRRSGGRIRAVAAAILFALALLTHESSLIFLPLLGLADLAFAGAATAMRSVRGWRQLVLAYAPFVVIAAAYLAVDLTINSRHYLVDEGHYRIGVHAVANTFDYIVSLYIGRRGTATYLIIAVALALLIARGTPRVRFAIAWVVLGILPFAFFDWGVVSRYQYLPAIGFGMLLAEGIGAVDRALRGRLADRSRLAVTAVLAATVVIRFMVFSAGAVEHFAVRTEMWRAMGERVRAEHPDLPPGGEVRVDADLVARHGFLYMEALVRWELRDPTVRVVVDPDGG